MGNNVVSSGVVTLDSFGDLMSAKDLSALLGVSLQTVRKEIKKGKFGKPWKIGREYRIPKIVFVERMICHSQE